jgi:CrcB protein
MIKNLLLVGLGGATGSMLRYAVTLLIGSSIFPYATLFVNIIGSFLIGLVIAFCIKDESIVNNWKLFLATGICGGFTTFSAFSMENMQLLHCFFVYRFKCFAGYCCYICGIPAYN